MKKLAVLFLMLMAAGYGISQEDCYDGVDNDADGDIDLNDDECDCAGFGIDTISSLIPNPSFEDKTCCPTDAAMLGCAETWEQASSATSDYFNTCDFIAKVGHTPPSFPLPGAAGGEGYAGFYDQSGWQEYIGACLTSPMMAGTPYVLNLWMAWGDSDNELDFAIYGTPDCGDLPWFDFDCPIGEGSWEELDNVHVTCPTDGSWVEVTMTFTPTVDMYAVCMGGDCAAPPTTWNYFYVDELVLLDSTSFISSGGIFETGSWCNEDLALNVDIDTVGGTWQWYYEGVALPGETSTTLDAMPTGEGTYQALYTIGSECHMETYELIVPSDPTADFSFVDQCDGIPINYTDESTISAGGTISSWDWDFGDSGTSSEENPSHTFSDPGTYTTQLIVTSDGGCTDTIEYDVEVFPLPTADFEFEINGESSSDGATGGCIYHTVNFTDFSNISGGTITDWDWDFGDGNTSSEENPSHDYESGGTFTITLTVTTADGCDHTFQMDIEMTEAALLDLISNNPTCHGFNDGSVTADITGGSGDPTIEITNEDGDIVNTTGSNTANSLVGGWYYVFIDDGSGCTAEGSVFLEDPGALDAELNLTFPLCHGDETGIAVVDEVINAQGDLDNITYIWNPDPPSVSGVGADSVWNLGAGTYSLTINDDFGCSNEIDFEIIEPDQLIFTEIGYDPAYCRLYHYQSGNGVVYAAAGGGTPDYTYEWINLSDSSSTTNTTWGGLNPACYEITVTDDNGCILQQEICLDSLNPIADFDVISDELNASLEGTAVVCASFVNQSLYFANPNNPTADTTFWWNLDSPDAIWTLSKDVNETMDTCYSVGGEYDVCLVVQNKNGCVDTTCKTITVFTPMEFEPVNIFSPDGDGVNDTFTFRHLAEGVKSFHCVIVNRWGNTLAEINDIEEGWDGKDKNGSTCNDGVYFYVYEGEAENGTPFSGQGTIQIIGTGNN